MSPRHRFASVLVAPVTAIGLIGAIGVASTATAAEAQPPPGQPFSLPSPSARSFGPVGHKPVGANASAPLPKPGPLKAILNSLLPRSAQVQQQAAVVPPPTPRGNQQPPTPPQPVPAAAPV